LKTIQCQRHEMIVDVMIINKIHARLPDYFFWYYLCIWF
jgi:hypothetical protein